MGGREKAGSPHAEMYYAHWKTIYAQAGREFSLYDRAPPR